MNYLSAPVKFRDGCLHGMVLSQFITVKGQYFLQTIDGKRNKHYIRVRKNRSESKIDDHG